MGYTQPMARTYQNPCPWTRVRVLTGTGMGCSEKPQGSPCPSLRGKRINTLWYCKVDWRKKIDAI